MCKAFGRELNHTFQLILSSEHYRIKNVINKIILYSVNIGLVTKYVKLHYCLILVPYCLDFSVLALLNIVAVSVSR